MDIDLAYTWLAYARHAPPLPLISEPNKVQQFQFQTSDQGYCYLRVFRNYTNQKLHDCYRVCYNFWTIYGSLSFFKFMWKIDHFTLDLLKRYNT